MATTRIFHIDLIKDIIRNASKDTLVVFDVDQVLIVPKRECDFWHSYRERLWENIKERISEQKREMLLSVVLSMIEWVLLEAEIISIIKDLESRCIPTIALTALGTGRIGVIEKLEDWRINQLNGFGINFANLTPMNGEILIESLQSRYGIPMLKEGIILTAEVDKGVVLEHILHYKNYYPKEIIFIDDRLVNIEAVERMCKKLQIVFHGFYYTALSLMSSPILDKPSEDLRFQILEKEHKWLNDKELAEIIRGLKY